jgi:NAD kinase
MHKLDGLEQIIGAGEVVRIVGLPFKERFARKESIQAQYILFSDQETILELEEQDYRSYHDCANYARILQTHRDKDFWQQLNNLPYKDAEHF